MTNARLMTDNSSFYKKLNPAVKFIAFILSIIFIFVPSGFFGQIVLLAFFLIVFFVAKIPKKMLFNIFKTAIFMFGVFIIVNWITYKVPIAYDMSGYNIVAQNSIFGPIWNGSHTYSNTTFISEIWGGNILGQIDSTLFNTFKSDETAMSAFRTWYETTSGSTDNINQILAQINTGTPLPFISSATTEDKKILLYMLNNDFSINGKSYNLVRIDNMNPSYMFDNFIINTKGAVVYTKNVWSYSPLGIVLALNITIKVSLIIFAASFLTYTTTSVELTNGLESLLSPLRIFKLPVSECAMILSIAIRFIPSLLGESKRILSAQAARGMDFNNGNLKVKIQSLVSLIVPLFSIAFKKSDDLANAMDARGYNPRRSRTQYRIYEIGFNDYVYLFCLTTIGLLVVFSLNLFHFYYGFLGIFEGALIFR